MWVFCKNDGVKQKKQVLSVKQTESYARADVIAFMAIKRLGEETCLIISAEQSAVIN